MNVAEADMDAPEEGLGAEERAAHRRFLNRMNQRKSRARRKARKDQLAAQAAWLRAKIEEARARLTGMDAEAFTEEALDALEAGQCLPALALCPAAVAQLESTQSLHAQPSRSSVPVVGAPLRLKTARTSAAKKAPPPTAETVTASVPPSTSAPATAVPAAALLPSQPLFARPQPQPVRTLNPALMPPMATVHLSVPMLPAHPAAATSGHYVAPSTPLWLQPTHSAPSFSMLPPAPSAELGGSATRSDYSNGLVGSAGKRGFSSMPPLSGYSLGSEEDTSGFIAPMGPRSRLPAVPPLPPAGTLAGLQTDAAAVEGGSGFFMQGVFPPTSAGLA